MSSGFSILDIPILTRLAWELCNQCQPVAKDAPDGFRGLVKELGSLHGTLRALGDDVTSNTSFFERMDEDRKLTLERRVDACFQTLQRLKALLSRYHELGIGEGKIFWQRIKWITQRTQIEDIRSKIMVHAFNLSLCVSSMRNASLARIERAMAQAMEDDEQALLALETPPSRDSELAISSMSPISPVSALSIRGVPIEYDESSEPEVMRQNRPRFPSQGLLSRSPHRRPKHTSTSSESMLSGSDGSFYGGTAPTSPLSLTTDRSPSASMMGRIGHACGRSDQLPYESSIDGRTVEKSFWEENSDFLENQSVDKASGSSNAEFGHNNVIEAVTGAMQQLRQVQLEEQLARPIRYEPQNAMHKPHSDIVRAFEASVEKELKVRRLVTRDWLRVATWWLLKARATLANCNRHNYVSARGSISPSTDSKSTSHQAYLDLLKASYILYDIVLYDQTSPALLTDENRKSVADLSEAINDELSQYTTIDIPEPSTVHSQNLDIWEPVQPEEASDSGADFSFGVGYTRWIAVDQDDAGGEEERVLYRTFVNAGIGAKKFRMRTKGAPYMLLLATKEGESEPKIVLCNQSGTLCLQRDFVQDDLPPLIHLCNANLTGFPGSRVSEPLYFKFNDLSVSISFQFETDLGQFVNIPKSYFDAVWQREPVDSSDFTESVIFKNSVEIFEQLKTPSMKSINPPVLVKSCQVRILERSYGEAWRSIRRIVISPSVAEKNPRCIEFFMPLSRVQISREDASRQVLLKWSDTCQERSDKTDGNYNTLYSYIYDDSAPNIGIGLHFHTQQGAEDFEKAILELNFRSDFAWSQPSSSGRIYDVIDTGIEHKQYKAVVLFQTRSSWRHSDVYYIYRDTDFAYAHASLSVRFPRASYADYISSHVEQLYRADSPVGFSHCEKKSCSATVEFNNEPVARSFMSALSPLYELLYSRRAQSLSTKNTTLFGTKSSSKGGSEVQLWRRSNTFQLAARWDDNIPDRWLTMALPLDCSDSSKESTRFSFPRLPYSRGISLDIMNILARTPKSTNIANKEGTISISFQNPQDRDEFLAVLQGRPLSGFI